MKNLISKHIYIASLMGLALCCVTWERLVETILPLRDEGKLKEAIAAGEKAKELAEKSGDTNSLEFAKILKRLGSSYINVGRYTLAESFLRRALLIEEKINANPEHIAEIQHLIGFIYIYEKKNKEAKRWLQMAINNFSKGINPNYYNFAECLIDLAGLTIFYDKNYEKSILLYKEAYSILKKMPPKQRALQEITLLSKQSSIYLKLKNYDQANILLNKAVDIIKEYSLLENPWTFYVYQEFGKYFMLKGEYKKSLQCYQKAMNVIVSSWGNENPYCAQIYDDIAGNYSRQKKYPKAIDYQLKAIDISNKYYGKDGVDNVSRLTYLSYLYFMNGNQADALRVSDDVFNLCERLGWRESDVFLLVLTTRAEIFRRLGREKDAAAVEAISHNKYNWK